MSSTSESEVGSRKSEVRSPKSLLGHGIKEIIVAAFFVYEPIPLSGPKRF